MSKIRYSFQYIQDDTEAWVIIDWLNGGYSAPVPLGSFDVNEEEYDTTFLNRGLTATLSEYTSERIKQKLNIHLNEFSYRFENTEDVGLPYLEKPSGPELDLFLKEALISTTGVREITSFASRVGSTDAGKYGKNKLTYFAEFTIKIETGEELWQSIKI